ncbi:hypothetical protein EDB85DRAFT_1964190, partial [Lactarius pseudohatsudake]
SLLFFLPIWFQSDAAGFRHELIPHSPEARTQMVIWQLGNCYVLLGSSSLFVFATIRDALPRNPVAQGRILGAFLSVMAVADVGSFHLIYHRITFFQVTK